MTLSILICTLLEREKQFNELITSLHTQLEKLGRIGYVKSQVLHGNYYINRLVYGDVEIIACGDNRSNTIGKKRNILMAEATGEYTCFIDDDDAVSENYISLILNALETKPDCLSLIGEITFDGNNPKTFIHSLKYSSYFEKDNIYYRCNNHLNVLKRQLAIQIPFPEKNFSEDTDFALQLSRSFLLETEVEIPETLYYYKFITNK